MAIMIFFTMNVYQLLSEGIKLENISKNATRGFVEIPSQKI